MRRQNITTVMGHAHFQTYPELKWPWVIFTCLILFILNPGYPEAKLSSHCDADYCSSKLL